MQKISELTEQEKSLMLAELMGWEIRHNEEYDAAGLNCRYIIDYVGGLILEGMNLVPYIESRNGLAQFAAILLNPEFIEVMQSWARGGSNWCWLEPTQSNILDEILIMQGKARR